MDLGGQCLKIAPDFVNKALVIPVPANDEVLIQWSFIQTNRQNLLALSTVDAFGNAVNYHLAAWRDTQVQYTLKNSTGDKQFWYLTGWETGPYDPTLDCPGRQDDVSVTQAASGEEIQFKSTSPFNEGNIHPGTTLVSVKLLF
jgi:hypothetical protein